MNKGRIIFSVLMGSLVLIGPAKASDSICAVVTKLGRGLQVIPEKGRVQTRLEVDSGIPCGSMVLTHTDPVWIKLSDQTLVKMGPQSFIEVPSQESKSFRMYRGAIMLSAPASLSGKTWSTPNAEVDFKGGVVVLQYLPEEKMSIAGCFNRKVEFRNKFNSKAVQELSAGEMSRLAIQEGRVQPTHPLIMHHSSVGNVLSRLGLNSEEQEQVVAVVKQVYEDRSKSLVSGIQDWSESEGPARSIASVPQSSKSTIDQKEAQFTMKLLKDRLYGTLEEQEKFVPPPVRTRAPASVLRDERKEAAEKRLKSETRRVEKEIDRLDPDSVD